MIHKLIFRKPIVTHVRITKSAKIYIKTFCRLSSLQSSSLEILIRNQFWAQSHENRKICRKYSHQCLVQPTTFLWDTILADWFFKRIHKKIRKQSGHSLDFCGEKKSYKLRKCWLTSYQKKSIRFCRRVKFLSSIWRIVVSTVRAHCNQHFIESNFSRITWFLMWIL